MASRPPLCVARAASAAGAPANAVELEDLVDIIKAVDTSDVVEMELTGKKFSMTVKKQEALQPAETTYVQAPVASATPESELSDHMTACTPHRACTRIFLAIQAVQNAHFVPQLEVLGIFEWCVVRTTHVPAKSIKHL